MRALHSSFCAKICFAAASFTTAMDTVNFKVVWAWAKGYPSEKSKNCGVYKKILVALENSRADHALIPHVTEFARLFKSELLLVHVADGWVARNYDKMHLAESQEMKEDRRYLERVADDLRKKGARVSTYLALGDPAKEILKTSTREHCDLIAMTMHGHGLLADIVLGSAIHNVRHKSKVPLFLARAK
jgi:manganese transport protein